MYAVVSGQFFQYFGKHNLSSELGLGESNKDTKVSN